LERPKLDLKMKCDLPDHNRMPEHYHQMTDSATAIWINRLIDAIEGQDESSDGHSEETPSEGS
jgi:hypothetical protein